MGTRAVFTFKDDMNTFSVYKHWDGYPSGAAGFLTMAIKMAWELPRFEACDFAAAFIAANKSGGGDVYFTTSADDHGDLSYVYHISQAPNGQLIMKAFEVGVLEPFFYGRLKDFVAKYGEFNIKKFWDDLVPSPHKIGDNEADRERVKSELMALAENNGFSITKLELI